MDSAYLAGVIDSDGSISITKRNTGRKRPTFAVMVQLTWVYNGLTERFFKELVSKYGGSYFKSDRSANRFKNAKPIIKYCATGKAAKCLLEALGLQEFVHHVIAKPFRMYDDLPVEEGVGRTRYIPYEGNNA